MKWLLALMVGLSLSLLSPSIRMTLAEDKEEKGTEEKITLDQCPKAVQETIQKEAGGGRIVEIEKETKGDTTIYEAEIVKNGTTIEIEVAADGKLLKSKAKSGKDEDDDENGDGNKGKEKGRNKE